MRNTVFLMTLAAIGASAQDRIPNGANIAIRTDDEIRINSNNADGRVYAGVVANDVTDRDGRVVIRRGSRAELIARRVDNSEMSVDLDSITVEGHRYGVAATGETRSNQEGNRDGLGANRRTGEFVGGGAALGTLLGAVAGGGKGAAIGAAAGAGAGAGTQVLTRGRNVNIPAETLLTFRLEQPLRIDVPDGGSERDGHHYHDNWDRRDNRRQ